VSIHFGILLVSVKTKVGSAMETARAIRSPETWNILESLGVRARRSPIDLAVKKNGCDIFVSVIFPYCVPWHFLDLFQKTARVIRWVETTTAVVWVWHPESSGGPTKS